MEQWMKTMEECIATAMDFDQNVEIVPFLPYILQDFWEMGTPPGIVIDIIQRYCKNYSSLNVLDLGCGKGVVSVKLAAAFKCHCFGIDAIPDFIDTSKEKAIEYGVDKLCRFETGDFRAKIEGLGKFDVIILGAVGPVFEDYHTTLLTLEEHLENEGIIIINDGYINNSNRLEHSAYLERSELLSQFERAGMELLDETLGKYSDQADGAKEMDNLRIRCSELKMKYPEKIPLFEKYLQNQADEYGLLENEIISAVMVIKRRKNRQ